MTNDEIISVARRHGATIYTNRSWKENPAIAMTMDKFQALIAELVAAEREICATVSEGPAGLNDEEAYFGRLIANAIRARGSNDTQ